MSAKNRLLSYASKLTVNICNKKPSAKRFYCLMPPRHDCKSYELWFVKCEDREAAVYHAELARRLDKQKACRQAAQALEDPTSAHWCYSLTVLEKTENNFKMVSKLRKAVAKNNRVPDSDVPIVLFANWSAPSLIKADSQRRQAATMGSFVNEGHSTQNFGLVLVPAHSWKKGLLWQEETKCREMLGNANVNGDYTFVMSYSRADARETRTTIWRYIITIYQ